MSYAMGMAYVKKNTNRLRMLRILTQDEEDLCWELSDEGWSRQSIARRLGIAESVVMEWAMNNGVTWSSEKTLAASKALREQAESARASLAVKLTRLADRAAADVEAMKNGEMDVEIFNFGGKDNDLNRDTLDYLPADTERAYAQAIDTYTRSVDRLLAEKVHGENEFSDVDGWLAETIGDAE